MFNWTKSKVWLTVNLVLVGLIVSLLGVQIVDKSDIYSDAGDAMSAVRIGVGDEKVITLGHIAYAAGSVDYTFDGTDDNVQFQAAMNALPATGGRLVVVSAVQINFSANVTRAIPNVTIIGSGTGTYFTRDGVNPTFTAGGNNWVFQDMRTDAGSLNMGATTGWMWTNVTVNATYYAYRSPYGQSAFNDTTVASLTDSGLTATRIPYAGVGGLLQDDADLTFDGTYINSAVGRIATYVVAASDAPAHVKVQADYLCDGTDDQTEINAALALGNVHLSEGNFYINKVGATAYGILLGVNGTKLTGEGAKTIATLGNNQNANVVYVDNNVTDCIVADFKIIGNRDNNADPGDHNVCCIRVRPGAIRTVVQRMQLWDGEVNGVLCEANYCKLVDNTVIDAGSAGLEFSGYFGEMIGNHILSITDRPCAHGIELISNVGCIVQGNYVERVVVGAGNGIAQGLFIWGGSNYHNITGNTFIRMGLNSIYMPAASGANDFNIIHNNMFYSCAVGEILSGDLCSLQGNIFYASPLTIGAGVSGTTVTDNIFYGASTFTNSGTASRIYQNLNKRTEYVGNATVANGTTTKVVTHNVNQGTPTQVFLTPTNDLGNATKFWVSNITSTQFTVNVDVDPGAGTATFAWRAICVTGEGY